MEIALTVILNLLAYYLIYLCIRTVFRFVRSICRGEGLVITPRDRAFIGAVLDAVSLSALVALLFSRRDS